MTENTILTNKNDLISVCICTFKRPKLLKLTIEGVLSQVTNSKFLFEIVVVDNDVNHSAESTVSIFQGQDRNIKVMYDCEPEQNIALTRNRAVNNANGNFIAFIDDDEFPEKDWLHQLYLTILKTGANGVLGPVLPHFETPPPNWIIKSGICERERLRTGQVISNPRYTRTGNVLIIRKTFDGEETPFNPVFGRTGGEDADFFKRKIEKGCFFVWCDEAIVFETVPPERHKRRYYLTRAFNRGLTSAIHEPFFSLGTLRSILAFTSYTLALPILFFVGHHLFMKYLIKDCDHISKLLAHANLNIVKKRSD